MPALTLLSALSPLLLSLVGLPLPARVGDDKPTNDPSHCPYTAGDPEELAKIGVVSLGGFPVGQDPDTASVDRFLGTDELRWVETAHFKLGYGLGPYKIPLEEKNSLRKELAFFAEIWPKKVNPKMRVIDPWLHAYLFARRLEAFYAEFQALVGVTDADFPPPGTIWNTKGKYMGQGPYLGEVGKFEVLVVPTKEMAGRYLREHYGLLHTKTQRWNILDKELIQVIIPAVDHLKNDTALHGHMRFNLAQVFLNGYRHYSYDMPIWLREGLGHWYERLVSPKFNTFDSSEGAVAQVVRKDRWKPEVRKLVAQGEVPSMARLMALRDYAGLERNHHLAVWSMVDFLISEHPGFLGKLIDRCAGLINDRFIPDGSGLPDEHRAVFRDELGMTYAQFDRAWRAWVLETYPSR